MTVRNGRLAHVHVRFGYVASKGYDAVWAIERDGTDAGLTISAPVEDWEQLLDEVLALDPGTTSITLPSRVEFGSVADPEMLQRSGACS